MEDILKEFVGKKVDVNCGTGAMYRGLIEKIDDGVVTIKDESEDIVYISVKRIIAFTECHEPAIRPGFIG